MRIFHLQCRNIYTKARNIVSIALSNDSRQRMNIAVKYTPQFFSINHLRLFFVKPPKIIVCFAIWKPSSIVRNFLYANHCFYLQFQ